MPHQCLSCSSIFENDDNSILMNGCSNCGKKLFIFIKKIEETEKKPVILEKKTKKKIINEIEKDIGKDIDEINSPIILKLESIKVISDGKYEIDINQLMNEKKPVIYRVEKGSYLVDLNYLK